MAKYTAKIEVTYVTEIEVEAASEQEAEKVAHEMARRGQFQIADFLGSNVYLVEPDNEE